MRQEIGKLVGDVDAQVVVAQADMDMHAADQQPPHHPAEIALQRIVAVLVGMMLILPVGEGMGRHGKRRQPVLVGNALDRLSQMAEVFPRLANRFAHARADLDLALQEFRTDLLFQLLHAIAHQRIGRRGQIQGFLVDQQIFLFNAKRQGRIGLMHEMSMPTGMPQRKPFIPMEFPGRPAGRRYGLRR